jgi:DnaK suppressor protein
MEQRQLEKITTELEGELKSVDRQLAEHGVSANGEGVEVDIDEGFADSAQATAERSQLLSIIDQLRDHRVEVTKALKRIGEGVYGKCERCGNQIPFERLEARPATSLCVTCKQELGA